MREFSTSFARLVILEATERGAATQRVQGFGSATEDLIGFCDDDIDLEPHCIANLRLFLAETPQFLGVAATVVNQAPKRVGIITQWVFRLLDSKRLASYDGRVIGPALNVYPVFDLHGPLFSETDWLNLGMTIYRKDALPKPLFDPVFSGYSPCEDVALSCRVAKKGRLAVLRDARIFHDSHPGDHKSDESAVVTMEVRNRFYIATQVLNKSPYKTWLQLGGWYLFCAVANFRRLLFRLALRQMSGAVRGLYQIAPVKFRE